MGRQEHNDYEKGEVSSQPWGHHGNRGTVYLEAVALTTIALPPTQEPSPLPIAIRVPTNAHRRNSFVGMLPFMWPTLRMHCPSTLQLHTPSLRTGRGGSGQWGRAPSFSAPLAQPS